MHIHPYASHKVITLIGHKVLYAHLNYDKTWIPTLLVSSYVGKMIVIIQYLMVFIRIQLHNFIYNAADLDLIITMLLDKMTDHILLRLHCQNDQPWSCSWYITQVNVCAYMYVYNFYVRACEYLYVHVWHVCINIHKLWLAKNSVYICTY